MSDTWKTIAIIFMILFILETAFLVWGIVLVKVEENQITSCYYEICKDYEDAQLLNGACICYEFDYNLNDYVVAKEEIMS